MKLTILKNIKNKSKLGLFLFTITLSMIDNNASAADTNSGGGLTCYYGECPDSFPNDLRRCILPWAQNDSRCNTKYNNCDVVCPGKFEKIKIDYPTLGSITTTKKPDNKFNTNYNLPAHKKLKPQFQEHGNPGLMPQSIKRDY